MPRLSLYKTEKGLDYKFIDRQASEMFQAGGTDVYVHKYLGANTASGNATADQPHYATVSPTNIQDLLFLENRDRKYDTQIYRIRGLYNVANIDFNLSQFGLFIDNDTLFMTVHINDFINYIGRKPISGDVLELPHLRDDFALNDFDFGLPRYYVIEDVGRASEGFSVTWFPHLYRLKLKRITDNQQFADIFNQQAKDANGDPVANTTLKDLLSTYNRELTINDAVVQQAELDAPKSGYETRQFYTLAADPVTGVPLLETADETDILASNASGLILASGVDAIPQRSGYSGYLLGDGFPANGYDFGFGIQFPSNPATNDFFLRVDFLPNRLFKFDSVNNGWIAIEDSVRMNMTNTDKRDTLKTGFINSTKWLYNEPVEYGTGFSHNLTPIAGKQKGYIPAGTTVINTRIPYQAAPYVVLTLDSVILDYAQADYLPGFHVMEDDGTEPFGAGQGGFLQINLPVVDGVQQATPFDGTWTITLYNTREAERQAISKVLKLKADL